MSRSGSVSCFGERPRGPHLREGARAPPSPASPCSSPGRSDGVPKMSAKDLFGEWHHLVGRVPPSWAGVEEDR